MKNKMKNKDIHNYLFSVFLIILIIIVLYICNNYSKENFESGKNNYKKNNYKKNNYKKNSKKSKYNNNNLQKENNNNSKDNNINSQIAYNLNVEECNDENELNCYFGNNNKNNKNNNNKNNKNNNNNSEKFTDHNKLLYDLNNQDIKDIKLDDLTFMGYNEVYDLYYSLLIMNYLKKNKNLELTFSEIPALYIIKNNNNSDVTKVLSEKNKNANFIIVSKFKKNTRMINFIERICSNNSELNLSDDFISTMCHNIEKVSLEDLTIKDFKNLENQRLRRIDTGTKTITDNTIYENQNLRYALDNELVNKFESYFNDIKLMSFTNYNNFENYYPLIIQYILYNLNLHNYNVLFNIKLQRKDLDILNNLDNLTSITNDELYKKIMESSNNLSPNYSIHSNSDNYNNYNNIKSFSNNKNSDSLISFMYLLSNKNLEIVKVSDYNKVSSTFEKYNYKYIYEFICNHPSLGIITDLSDYSKYKLKKTNSYTYHLYLKLKNKNNYMKINNNDLFNILDTKFYKYYSNVEDISKLSQTNLNYLVVIPFFNFQNIQVIIHKNELTFNKI